MSSMVKDETAPPAQQRLPGVPVHVGVIMDGNGRWAARRGLPRIEGHRRGVEALRETVRAAIDFGLDYLTVYSFSMENWNRPVEEVADLMGLLKRFIRNDLNDLHKSGVKVKVIGARDNLKADIRALLDEAENLTRANTRLTLIVAFNYGSRQEIAAAARALARRGGGGPYRGVRYRRGPGRPPSRHGGNSRSRSHHPDIGRTETFEFSHVAGGLFRVRFSANALAGLRPAGVLGGPGGIFGP